MSAQVADIEYEADEVLELLRIADYDTRQPCSVCGATPETPCVYTSAGEPKKGEPRSEPHYYGGRSPFEFDVQLVKALVEAAEREAVRRVADAYQSQAAHIVEWLYSMANSPDPLPPRAGL